MLRPKIIHTWNLITKKIPAAQKFPHSPYNFSNRPSLRRWFVRYSELSSVPSVESVYSILRVPFPGSLWGVSITTIYKKMPWNAMTNHFLGWVQVLSGKKGANTSNMARAKKEATFFFAFHLLLSFNSH